LNGIVHLLLRDDKKQMTGFQSGPIVKILLALFQSVITLLKLVTGSLLGSKICDRLEFTAVFQEKLKV
jgi:hypothetical protein